MRPLAAVASVFLLVAAVFAAPPAYADSRRAVLVMDVDTGKVLRQENAHARRYPASLTKMMTLYLLFDALRKGDVKLSSQFTASKYAAQQPQTNISLRPGDKVSVEEAINALVVRSANDVAVVVAEGLGRSEWNFGVMMTQQARDLGMKDTVFRNPHGLPNSRQYTTAYDMALLGIALRRDFPQYYHYFTTQSFRYKGRTYTGHNRVIGRFGGVDGIKTGFINASGFNLVTSVKRDGFFVVGVVMGGPTAAARDNEMVALMQTTFAAYEREKGHPRQVANAPAPKMNPRRAALELAAAQGVGAPEQGAAAPAFQFSTRAKEQAHVAEEEKQPAFSLRFSPSKRTRMGGKTTARVETVETKEIAQPQQDPLPLEVVEVKEIMTPSVPAAPAAKASPSKPPAFKMSLDLDNAKPAAGKALPPKGTLEYQLAMIESGQGDVGYEPARPTKSAAPARTAGGKEWGIQVGAFREEAQARDAVRKAFALIEGEVGDAYIAISTDGAGMAQIHRARLGNLSRTQADAACRKLNAKQQSCFAVQMD